MSVLHVLIFLFWKPFDFCPVIFFGPKLISTLFLKKQGSCVFLLSPPPGGGEGGALLARIFTDTGRSERKVQKTFRVYLKNPISYFRAYFVHFWLVFPQYFVYNRSFLPPNLLTRTEIMNFLTVNGPTFLKIVLK